MKKLTPTQHEASKSFDRALRAKRAAAVVLADNVLGGADEATIDNLAGQYRTACLVLEQARDAYWASIGGDRRL